MTEDQHEHDGHGDATLDVIALLEAALKDDDHGMDVLLESVLASGHLSHVIGTLVGVLADEMAGHHGRDGALQILASQRGHALGSHQCDHGEAAEPGSLTAIEDPADRIGFEVSEVAEQVTSLAHDVKDGLGDIAEACEQNGGELTRLVNAVERLGDILDKRLA
jgi:hypothetical protein